MSSIELTQDEFNSLFTDYPEVAHTEAGAPLCPYCGAPLGPQALGYWEASTEAGTPFSDVEITCQSCGKAIWRGGSWTSWIESKADLMEVVTDVLDDLARFGLTSTP